MDPVTLALFSGGLLVFGTMIFFFLKAQNAVENARKYKAETEEMNRVIEINTRELENLKRELKRRQNEKHNHGKDVSTSAQQVTDPQIVYTRKSELKTLQESVNQLIEEMDEARPKWKDELGISNAILGLSGTYNVSSALTLVKLILRSIVLSSHLTNPQGAIRDVRRKTIGLEAKVQNLTEKVELWIERQEEAKLAQQASSVNILNVLSGDYMSSSNYNITGGNQGAVGDQAQASDFVQVSQTNQKASLAEAAAEIQKLLKQLEESNPNASEAERIAYLNDETTPKFKKRVIGALQAGGGAAIEEFLDNPYVNVGKATIEGWIKAN